MKTLRHKAALPDAAGSEEALNLLRGDAPLTAEPVRAELTRFNPATDAFLADAEEFGDLANGPHATSPATIFDLRHLTLL
jgi:hypothetical protein